MSVVHRVNYTHLASWSRTICNIGIASSLFEYIVECSVFGCGDGFKQTEWTTFVKTIELWEYY